MQLQTTFIKRLLSTCLAAAVVFATGPVGADESAAPARPTTQFLRFNEDWSTFAGHEGVAGLDRLKYVALSDDGSVWASFGGHVRMRVENWNDFGFGGAGQRSDTFLLTRIALHADVHVGDNIRVFAEGTSALSTDRDLPGAVRGLDMDTAEMQQLFVDVTVPVGEGTLTVRTGRQQFLFGKQRLVSPLPWANTLRRWDGIAAILQVAGWSITGFYAQFVPVRKYEPNRVNSQQELWGVYATRKGRDDQPSLDVYFLGLDNSDHVTFNMTTGSEDRYTVGGRLWGKCPKTGFDFDIEGAYQFGRVDNNDISAWMLALQVGYKLADWAGRPRVYAGFDYASGDDSAGGDVQTFNQVFPLGHAYLGYIDAIGRQNIIDLSTGVIFKPFEKTTVKMDGHFFWQADDNDAVYNAGGGVLRGPLAGADDFAGVEFDLLIKQKICSHVEALFGYSHFFAGGFIDDTGADKDIDFVYTQVQFTF